MKENKENVNHPDHYQSCSIECIQNMMIAFGEDYTLMWCLITAYKYIYRYKFKNGIEDLKKAEWYLQYVDIYVNRNDINLFPPYFRDKENAIKNILNEEMRKSENES